MAVGRLVRAGFSAVLLVALMFLGSLGVWVGIPVLWLWVGSRIQGATQSLGAAIGVALLGVVVSILLALPVLSWLSRKHAQIQEARGIAPQGRTALESVMVVSATLALMGFAVWFFLLSGSEPVPLGLPK